MTTRTTMDRAFALLLTATALAGLGCGKAPEMLPPPPPEVTVDTPVRREVTLFAEFTGTTESVASVEIRARVSGELEEMTFEPSSIVEKGDRLFVIEPRPYRASLGEAKAGVAAAEAGLARTEADLDRLEFAVKTDAVSQSDVDLARAQRDMAIASLQSAEASLDTAELQLSYTNVTSPIAGQVSRNLVDVGNLVSSTEATLLTTVKRMQPIFIYFDGPERVVLTALDKIKEMQRAVAAGESPTTRRAEEKYPVFVATLADSDFPHEAYIDYVDNTVNSDTGTIQIRALFPNDHYSLFPGLFVRVRVPTTTIDDAILVDERAVGTDLGGKFIYVIDTDNVVAQRYIELAPVEGDGMVPVLEGLDGDERYVRAGVLRARPGMPVTPTEAAE